MKSLCTLVTLALLALVSTAKAQDGVLLENTNYSQGNIHFFGQSFTTPNDIGNADTLTGFAWLVGGNPVGSGDVYLFTQAYTGTPTGLSSAGAVGKATWNATTDIYDFSLDSITLAPNTEYYIYGDLSRPAGENANGTDVFAGGDAYQATSSTGDFVLLPNDDMTFEVTATSTPEPGVVALGGLAAIAFFVVRKVPRRAKATISAVQK